MNKPVKKQAEMQGILKFCWQYVYDNFYECQRMIQLLKVNIIFAEIYRLWGLQHIFPVLVSIFGKG
jgi:hypothetical protein